MKIGLINVDSKNIGNLAIMKLSAYHKKQGDTVELYSPLLSYGLDLIYISKVFKFTPDYQYCTPEGVPVVRGGSGYDLKTVLPPEIENIDPDYSLFDCGVYKGKGRQKKKIGEFALGFTSRGCIRRCKFCIVPEKEGLPREVADIYDFWRKQSHIILIDNNLTSLPGRFEKTCQQLIKEKVKTDFNQGLDIRLITPEMAQLLGKVRLWKQIHFAWDSVRHEGAVRRGIDILVKNGVAKHKLMFYVLIGFDSTPEEDMYRVEVLRGLDVDPYVMPFNKNDTYQSRFARWVNHKATFFSTPWEKYEG